MNMNFTKLLLAFFMMGFLISKAQLNQSHEHDDTALIEKKLKSVQHDFDPDSLRGFNENAAWEQARMGGGPDWEQKMQVSYSKRRYINTKYGVVKYFNQSTNPTVQAPCTNVDFENGTASGWTITEGLNSNSTTMGGCCPTASTRYSVVTAGTDPSVSALQRVPAGAGNYTLKIGDGSTTGGYAVRAKQTFSVSASNSVFIYKFAVVLEDGGHTCSEQPYFNITFTDASNNPIPCGDFNVVQAGSGCSSGADPSFVTSGIYSYKNWSTRAFDLSSYIGQNVTVEFTASDCTLTGHAGWAYVDASCQPMTLNLNGSNISVGQTNSASCGAVSNNTLCAPPGFGYTWTGPGVTGQTGQCVNAASAGSYSVSLSITGAVCAFSPVLYSNFTYSPNPVVTASVTQPVCAAPAGSATITATSGLSPYTYSWTPAAPSTSVNANLPTNTQYTVSVNDANGCSGSTTFSINPYPPAPAYTLATVPGLVLSCTNPTITMTFAATNSSTTAQWSGPSGSITGTTSVITAPGVYTYTAINTVSTCSLTGTVNITGSVVYPVVTSTVTQPACALPVGSATVSAAGTGPYTYTWTAPASLPYNTNNTNLPPGSSYTVFATDAIGCTGSTTFSVNNFSGAAGYTLTNIPGLALTCPSPSTTLTFAPTNTNTTTQWTDIFGLPITGTTSIATQTGVYSYTASNTSSGCAITGTIGVTSLIAQPSATTAVVCNSVGIQLTGITTDPEFTLNWASPTNTLMGNPATSTATAVFTLTVANPLNGCSQTYTATSIRPTVGITSVPSTNTITCAVPVIQATAVASPTNTTILWSNGVSTSTANPYPISAAGTYTALVQIQNGCPTQSVIIIGSNTAADVMVTSTSTVISCATGSLSLNASGTTGGGPYVYVWTPATPTFTGNPYIATNSGTYTVVALNTANGCTATAIQVVSQETISASFIANPHNGLMPLAVTFTNTSSPNATTFNWNLGTGPTYTTTNAAIVYNAQGSYTVILTARNGMCVATATDVILVDLVSSFNVPNVFTPNGDGRNDVFTFDAKNMGEINLTIFDRWGLKMFESTDSGNVIWDGKNKGGNTVTDGTYFYIIKATGLDNTPYNLKGTVNIFQ